MNERINNLSAQHLYFFRDFSTRISRYIDDYSTTVVLYNFINFVLQR